MTSTTKKTRLIHDPSTEYNLHPSEGPGNALTKHVLKGDNFDTWEKTIVNALKGRIKASFLSPVGMAKPTDPMELEAWEANNSTICSWIFNSVDETIQPSIASHTVVHELWTDVKARYSTVNEPHIYQLENELQNLHQKGQTVVVYYNQFVTIWNKLYGMDDPTCGCKCEAATQLKDRAEKSKTRKFLLGLDDEQFGSIRGQILGTQPLVDLNKAFYLITQEERHKNAVRARDDHTDAMAFATTRATSNGGRGRQSPSRGGGRGNRGGRTAAQPTPTAVRQHGGTAGPSAHAAAESSSSLSALSSEQVARLFSMLEASHSTPDKLQVFPFALSTTPTSSPEASSRPTHADFPTVQPVSAADQPTSPASVPAVSGQSPPQTDSDGESAPDSPPSPTRPTRDRRPPTKLSDYYCHTARTSTPVVPRIAPSKSSVSFNIQLLSLSSSQ
ncbi:unnamed protein product [Cuscuta campestris]|uniref:Retrotransposon gag domain-containing protein n=1 Tax=Cuscuta campestris TaxID=132261 RepID=A0A484LJ50_9ASTE|nr:unnamed protein product [Cuscuta campestris]